jgi:hypothetical protein
MSHIALRSAPTDTELRGRVGFGQPLDNRMKALRNKPVTPTASDSGPLSSLACADELDLLQTAVRSA